MDADQLRIEEQRLELDERRVALEERKARHDFWTKLGIVVPIFAAALVFAGNLVVQRLQADDAIDAQKRQAADAFELKVAELIMDSEGPYETRGRAVALSQLFPNRVATDFVKNYDPEQATNRANFERDQRVASKKELIALLAAHPADSAFIVRTWRQLFPADTWLSLLESRGSPSTAPAQDVSRDVSVPDRAIYGR